ncbi:MAG TPA: hypothetical protein VHE53_02985 [Patescibacteria group bacterium]|nr:hypothetical protein [Patescibacteria group bacterium]
MERQRSNDAQKFVGSKDTYMLNVSQLKWDSYLVSRRLSRLKPRLSYQKTTTQSK